MYLRKALPVFFYLISQICSGQSTAESIKALLNATNDSLKVELMVRLTMELSSENPDSSLFYAVKAELLAKELESPYLLAKSLNSIGVAYYYLNDLEQSNEYYFEALTIFDSLQEKQGIARALNNIGWNYKLQEFSDEAIEYFNRGLKLARESNDLELTQGILNNLGTVYEDKKNYGDAMEIFKQSLELNKQLGNEKWEAFNLNNIGNIYLHNKEYHIAMRYFEEAGKLNKKNGLLEEYTSNMLNLGQVNVGLKKYLNAENYYEKAHEVIKENGFKRSLLDYFQYMIDLQEKGSNYQGALIYQRKRDSLNNVLNRIDFNKKVGELQTKYEVARQERDLEEYQKKVNRQRFVIYGGTTMFLLLLSLLFVVLKLYKAKNLWAKNVEQLNNEIHEKAEELKSINKEIQEVNDNLEILVAQRTEEIKEQNQKLVKYAFINSHEIRGPLARILGLVFLLGHENEVLNKNKSFKLLRKSASELDDIVKSASKILEDKDIFKQN